MPSIYCSVSTCSGSKESTHRFPDPRKNMPLFVQWVRICANRRLHEKDMTVEKIYNNCRVCRRHFSDADFGPNNRLKPGVLPSLNIPVLKTNTIDEPTTSTFTDQCSNVELSGSTPEVDVESNVTLTSQQPTTAGNIGDHDYCQEPVLSDVDRIAAATEPSVSPVEPTQNIHTFAEPSTPPSSRRQGLLAEINTTRSIDLTPKAKHMYEKACYFRRKAARSDRTKLTLKQRLKLATKYTESEAFKIAVSSMDEIRARFFQCQIENTKKRAQGRRYTLEDKILGLALFKQSGSAYKFLSKLFVLPSHKTCIRLLERIPMKPGLSEPVFDVLKGEVKTFKNPLDKYCTLMFDEMSLSPGLTWNKFDGDVEGFEDFGYKRSDKIANHVMVVMLRGIRKKWKQPVYYNFVNGATNNADISNVIKVVIEKCASIGLQVVATVCDQGKNNEAAINNLVWETQRKYKIMGKEWNEYVFEINGNSVIPLFDVPHLLKGIRNNLLKANLVFKMGEKEMVAKWNHVQIAYQLDPHLGSLRCMPKLTDHHINPNRINKMKVSYCTQVFSRTVAVGINLMSFSGTSVVDETGNEISLGNDAQDTAKLIEFMDELFDSLNGSSLSSTKILRRAVTDQSDHMAFWNKAINILSSMHYITDDGKKKIPPSIKNFIKTINNFKVLYNYLKGVGFKYLLPRTFNQDPVENFFCKIRQRGARNNNPTCSMFTAFYKSLLVNTLTSSHSVGANCMEDDAEYLITLQRLVTQGLPEEESEADLPQFTPLPKVFKKVENIQQQVLRYVCGYLVKKAETTHKDCECIKDILNKSCVGQKEDELFTTLKEYDRNTYKLKYVSESFVKKMNLALQIINFVLNRDLHKTGVFKHILNLLTERINFSQCDHNLDLKKTIFSYFIKVTGHNFIKQLNRIIKGHDLRVVPQNAPSIFKNCKNIYNKTYIARRN